jgi:hypothetical protein
MSFGRIGASAAVFLGGLVAVACTVPDGGPSGHIVGLDDIDLTEVAAVLYLSPQAQTWGSLDPFRAAAKGYVAFIEADGDYQLVSTGGMDSNAVAWTNDGLFFSDMNRDYLLQEGQKPIMFDSPKTDYLDGLVVLENGRHVGVYNAGFDPAGEGYIEEVVVTDAQRSIKHVTNRWATLVAGCGNSVYALDEDSAEVPEGEPSVITLNALVRDGAFAGDVIARHESVFEGTSFASRSAPCVGGEILFLASSYGPSSDADAASDRPVIDCRVHTGETGVPNCPTIERWDTRTGARLTVPVIDQTGLSLDMSIDPFDYSVYDSGSVQDKWFYWWHSSGHLLRTDIDTGRTTLLATQAPQLTNGYTSYHLRVSGSRAFVLEVPSSGGTAADNPDMRLLAYEIPSGELLSSVTIPGLNKAVGVDRVDRGFAVRPALLGTE